MKNFATGLLYWKYEKTKERVCVCVINLQLLYLIDLKYLPE